MFLGGKGKAVGKVVLIRRSSLELKENRKLQQVEKDTLLKIKNETVGPKL